MATFRDLRKAVRETLDDPRLAVVFFETQNSSSHYFANVINLGVQGVLIESDKTFENGAKPKIMMKNPELNQWDTFFCRVAWAQVTESEKQYKTGLEFLFPVEDEIESDQGKNGEIGFQDIEFLLNTHLMKTVSKDMLCPLLNCMTQKTIQPGASLISRQDHEKTIYIIQKGHCSIQDYDENGLGRSTAKKKPGDIIGDMSFFCNTPLITDAVSDSELVVWELPAKKYDMACRQQPGLIHFLTGLLASRFQNPSDTETKSLGRYLITHPMGEDRACCVYKGRHRLLNIPVSIKMIKHHFTRSPEDLTRLKKKISRVCSLRHPGIADVYAVEEHYRTLFIITEHVDGVSLESLFDNKIPIAADTVMLILAQICSALSHAHDQKAVHGYLSPSSVFISHDRRIRIADFGLTGPIPEEGSMEDRNLYYMPPEMIKGGKADVRSDIYSLGILAYEMATGQIPSSKKTNHPSRTEPSDTGKMEVPNDKPPALPSHLKQFVLKACATAPEKRYASIREIIQDLSETSSEFKHALSMDWDMGQTVYDMLLSCKKNQFPEIFRLLDDFSAKAADKGITISMAGRIQI